MRYYVRWDRTNNRMVVSTSSVTPDNHADMMNSPSKQMANLYCIAFINGATSGVTPINDVHEFTD